MQKRSNWQKIMFSHIRESLPAEINLAKWLGEILCIDSSNVYRRIRGEKPLLLAELNIIARNLPELSLILERTWGVDNRTYALLLDLKNWLQVQDYLRELVEIHNGAQKNGQAVLAYYSTLPLTLILGNKHLMRVGFSLICGRAILNDAMIPHPVKRLVFLFLRASGKSTTMEIWNYKGIEELLNRVFYLYDIGGIPDRDFHLFRKELTKSVRQYFIQSEKGSKRLGGKAELFISEFELMDTAIFSHESNHHCFGSPFTSVVRLSHEPRAADLVRSRWADQRSVSTPVGKLNRRYSHLVCKEILGWIEKYGGERKSLFEQSEVQTFFRS